MGANLETIARAVRAGLREGGTLVWTSTTPPPYPQASDHAGVACVDERNAIALEVLAQFDVVVNDLHSEFNGACGENFTSCALQQPKHNVHPTPAGRQFLAIKTASVIAPFLNMMKRPLAPQFAPDDTSQMFDPEQPQSLII